jgi:hypothetical protein
VYTRNLKRQLRVTQGICVLIENKPEMDSDRYEAIYSFNFEDYDHMAVRGENYIILQEHIKCILTPLTEVVNPTMNLISGTHYFCERREYAFNALLEYDINIQ